MVTSLLVFLAAASAFQFEDAFDYADGTEGSPAWFAESIGWSVEDGALVHAAGGRTRTFAILEASPHGKELTIEASVRVEERLNTEWAVAGVGIRRDDANYWHLALVESPEADGHRHFVELQERLDGVWLATSQEGTRLTMRAGDGHDFNWQYGATYRLKLAIAPSGVEGVVYDTDNKLCAHLAFAFDGPAVTSGGPVLDCGGFAASFDDVKVNVVREAPAPVGAAETFPPYTPLTQTPKLEEGTGFFHTKSVDGKWWLVDPAGNAFYIVGTDHARYSGHWCEKLGYAPYGKVAKEKYGSEEAWAEVNAKRLIDWGFNTVTAGHSKGIEHRGLAHTGFLSMGSTFSSIDDICPKTYWTGFPNVFSPAWPRHCDKVARAKCAPVKDDPWLVGYFIDNELEWYGKDHTAAGLFNEAWKKPFDHSAKQAWIAFLKERFPSASELAGHWDVDVENFDALARHCEPTPGKTERAGEMAQEWVRLIADRYFAVAAEAIRRHDPNHMVIGSRFAGRAPDIWDIAGEYCDVVSFNMYPRIDIEQGVPQGVIDTVRGWADKAGKPMMITEWSFPALDSGLPCQHGAGMRVDTQAQRTKCFAHFQELMFSLPFMVGSDFFMFLDEPELGISTDFPEDTNYGLVNGQDEPYPEITQAATALNPRVYTQHEAGEIRAAKPARLHDWLTAQTFADVEGVHTPLEFKVGALTLKGGPTRDPHGPPLGPTVWEVWLGGTLLGEWRAMMHENLGQDLWVTADTSYVTFVGECGEGYIVEMEISRANAGDATTRAADGGTPGQRQRRAPHVYSSKWRFRIPKEGSGWFSSECLSLTNTGIRPWRVVDVFHYFYPRIGGDQAHDRPLTAGVPNYYLRGAAWVDSAAGAGVGCWYPYEGKMLANYWLDERGGHHSDLRMRVDKELKPGETIELMPVPAFFFAIPGTSMDLFREALRKVRGEALAPAE